MADSTSHTLLRHRVLVLTGPIGPRAAAKVISGLLLLDRAGGGKPIDLYLNSPGGRDGDALAITEAISLCRCPVRTIRVGRAFGVASVVLAAGRKGHRFASPGGLVSLPAKLDDQADRARGPLRERLQALLLACTGGRCGRTLLGVSDGAVLDAAQAKAANVIDEILVGAAGVQHPAPRTAQGL